MDKNVLIATWFRQQKELAMPDLILDPTIADFLTPRQDRPGSGSAGALGRTGRAVLRGGKSPAGSGLKNRLSSLRPIDSQSGSTLRDAPVSHSLVAGAEKNLSEKRESLKEMYLAGCSNCRLSGSRRKFVFGSGAAEARVMIIGEAPGEEEDEQGLPFVGAAGKLLTSMLAAIDLDRTRDVFITNVLKCRPPEDRDPEASEIASCMPVLSRQIEIIRPNAVLLLGRVAAHSLLGRTEAVSVLRTLELDIRGVPAVVTYHPAALLRDQDLKRPAWEDLRRFRKILSTQGVYGTLHEK